MLETAVYSTQMQDRINDPDLKYRTNVILWRATHKRCVNHR